jgi:FMN phosphatase YigB (HAD superfamily)
MKRIIVDIDNTLWDFAAPFWKKIRHLGVPRPSEWTGDFWKDYFTVEQFLRLIDEVHEEQDAGSLPFPEAAPFLAALKTRGCPITIASHRNPASRGVTEKWLKVHGLAYDELYVGPDKTVLFDDHQVIVDDSAELLDKAATKGLITAGLRYPWNRDSGHCLFENLSEILVYLNAREREEDPIIKSGPLPVRGEGK